MQGVVIYSYGVSWQKINSIINVAYLIVSRRYFICFEEKYITKKWGLLLFLLYLTHKIKEVTEMTKFAMIASTHAEPVKEFVATYKCTVDKG